MKKIECPINRTNEITDQTKYNIITTAKCITYLATEGYLCTLCKFKSKKDCNPISCFRVTRFSQNLLDRMEEYYVNEKNK